MTKILLRYLFIYFLFAGFKSLAQAEQGSISPTAKKIQAETIGNFSEGFAMISNENSSAIINSKGDIVVPFNKYWIYDEYRHGAISCSNLAKNAFGYLNLQGKLSVPLLFVRSEPFNADGFATNIISKSQPGFNKGFYSVSNKGVLYPIMSNYKGQYLQYAHSDLNFQDGIINFNISINKADKSKYGFVNRLGQVVIPPKYDGASQFNEGLAAVAINNSQGQYKWGIIDKADKTIIPFQFSKQPDGFSEGLCLVESVSNPEFDFAYIDRKGEVKIKLKSNDKLTFDGSRSTIVHHDVETNKNSILRTTQDEYRNRFGMMGHPFQSGIAFWQVTVDGNRTLAYINLNGNVTVLKDLLKKNGIEAKSTASEAYEFYPVVNNNMILFKCNYNYGLMNIDGGIVIKPIFSLLTHFDPISHLAYAIKETESGLIEGYIDRKGVFQIIRVAKSGL